MVIHSIRLTIVHELHTILLFYIFSYEQFYRKAIFARLEGLQRNMQHLSAILDYVLVLDFDRQMYLLQIRQLAHGTLKILRSQRSYKSSRNSNSSAFIQDFRQRHRGLFEVESASWRSFLDPGKFSRLPWRMAGPTAIPSRYRVPASHSYIHSYATQVLPTAVFAVINDYGQEYATLFRTFHAVCIRSALIYNLN